MNSLIFSGVMSFAEHLHQLLKGALVCSNCLRVLIFQVEPFGVGDGTEEGLSPSTAKAFIIR